jgi:class 3 adenylate cyclase
MAGAGQERFILYTDIGRSTWLWEKFPDRYPSVLEAHNRATEAATIRNGGDVLSNTGDGYVCLFDTPVNAVMTAVELQQAFSADAQAADFAFPDGMKLQLRAVVHGGTLQRMPSDNRWYGTALHRASRICHICYPGQTIISAYALQGLDGLPHQVEAQDLGRVQLRDLSEPERLWQLNHPGFAYATFPPLITLDTTRNNLSAQPNAFIGRERELADLMQLVAGPARLVTLMAPGGYGKSRLASQLCAKCLDHYTDGVFEVQLAPLSNASDVPDAILAAIGQPAGRGANALDHALAALSGKRMLLCLQGFENVMAATTLVDAVLHRNPGLRVIATSRQPLRLDAEHIYPIEPLSTGPGGDAERLFADRAALVKPGFEVNAANSTALGQLCGILEGIPMSIELVAACADNVPLEQMASELTHQISQSPQVTDMAELRRSIRAALEWTHGRRYSGHAQGETLAETLHVDPSGAHQGFHTISDAVTAANPGARIFIHPGVYREELTLTKPVELIGSAPREQVVIASESGHCVHVNGGGVTLHRLTLRVAPGPGETAMSSLRMPLAISRGRAQVSDCVLEGRGDNCVAVYGIGAELDLRLSYLYGCKQTGLSASQDGRAMVVRCQFTGCGRTSVYCGHGGQLRLEQSIIEETGGYGLLVDAGGHAAVLQTELKANFEDGVFVRAGGTASLQHCTLALNRGAGVAVQFGGTASLAHSALRENQDGALNLEFGARVEQHNLTLG